MNICTGPVASNFLQHQHPDSNFILPSIHILPIFPTVLSYQIQDLEVLLVQGSLSQYQNKQTTQFSELSVYFGCSLEMRPSCYYLSNAVHKHLIVSMY